MKRISPALALAATLAFGVAPALAALNGHYRGQTSKGLTTRMHVRGGLVQTVNIPWSTKNCAPRDGYRFSYRRFLYTNNVGDPIEQHGKRFSDSGTNRVHVAGGGSATVTAHMKGRFTRPDRAVGKQTITVRSRDRFGRHTCTSRVRWSATLQLG